MSLHEFKAGAFGAIQTHSLAVSFNFTNDTMSGLYSRYGDGKSIHEERVLWSDFRQSDRDAYLTDLHELDHFVQLISTPAGVLVWRLYQVLYGDVSWLGETYQEHGVNMNCKGFPLVEWHRNSGRSALENTLRNKQDGNARLQYIDHEVVAGIEAVDQLLRILTCLKPRIEFRNYTVGKFVNLLNFVFPYLSRRCSMPWGTIWKSRNPEHLLFPDDRGSGSVNLRGVLEVLSYAKEHRSLAKMRATPNELADWEMKRVPVEFKAAFQFFLHSKGNATAMRGYLGKCLLGRIDLCSCPQGQTVLYVEDEWPWWRSKKSVEDLGGLLADDLAGLYNLCSQSSLYGPNSWESRRGEPPKEGFSRDPWLEDLFFGHLKRLDKAFLRACKTNLASLMELIQGRPSTIQNEILNELLLVEFKDVMLFYRPATLINEMFGAVLFGMLVCLGANVARATVMQPPEQTGIKLANSIERLAQRLEKAGAREAEPARELSESVRQMFTRRIFERFVGGSNVMWDE